MPRTRTYTHKSGRGLPTSHACLLPTPKHPPGLRRRIAAVDASTKPGPALPAPTPGSLPSPTGIPTSAEASGGPLHIPQSPRKQLKSNHHKHSLYNQPQPAERGCLSPPYPGDPDPTRPGSQAPRPWGPWELPGGGWVLVRKRGGASPVPGASGRKVQRCRLAGIPPHPIPSHPILSPPWPRRAKPGPGLDSRALPARCALRRPDRWTDRQDRQPDRRTDSPGGPCQPLPPPRTALTC